MRWSPPRAAPMTTVTDGRSMLGKWKMTRSRIGGGIFGTKITLRFYKGFVPEIYWPIVADPWQDDTVNEAPVAVCALHYCLRASSFFRVMRWFPPRAVPMTSVTDDQYSIGSVEWVKHTKSLSGRNF